MTSHEHTTFRRHCDVAVIGGSAAGLAAALQLARQHRSVIVVDSGEPGPDAIATAREEVRSHGVEVLTGVAVDVIDAGAGVSRVELAGGHVLIARRVLAATGLTDQLDGSRAADVIGDGLAHDDLSAAARPPANEVDWDHRYAGERLWSGNPNGTLVHEVGDLPVGRALDVGAGEGGDAFWLADRGWDVTANDVSPVVLAQIAAHAEQRGLRIACRQADANAVDAFPTASFDLVSAQYPAIPRTPDARGVHNMIDAVAPGGTLLVVGHDLEPEPDVPDVRHGGRGFDAEAYLRVDEFVAALDEPSWIVEVHETRPRPPGAASGHHVNDVVLRARRRAVVG